MFASKTVTYWCLTVRLGSQTKRQILELAKIIDDKYYCLLLDIVNYSNVSFKALEPTELLNEKILRVIEAIRHTL